MKGLIGKKLGMTQVFDANGQAIPVTVIAAGPCQVVCRRSKEKDGYDAVQLGFEEIAERRLTKPVAGQFKAKKAAARRYLREFRIEPGEAYQEGQELDVDQFKPGELVDIVGISKGKGFAGVMKRHRFSGGPRSHGSMSHRRPASNGSTDAARTFKGQRRPGQLGNVRVTAKALKIVEVNKNNHMLLVKGNVPGASGGLVLIRESYKRI